MIGIHKISLGADLGSVLNKGIPTYKKEVELSPLLPSFVHYRIPIKEFAEHVVQWFKIEKGWDVVVTVGSEPWHKVLYIYLPIEEYEERKKRS